MHAGPSEHPTLSITVANSKRIAHDDDCLASGMDGLWKQENTAGKVQVLEGKAQRHLAGKEWFVPMSRNEHSYVTKGRQNLEHSRVPKAGSEAVWYWKSTGSESGA